MQISWGHRARRIPLAPASRRCERCNVDREFATTLDYRCEWVFDEALSRVSTRRYSATCTACGNSLELETARVERELGRDPIPWQDRLGFFVGGGTIAAVAGIVFLIIRFAR